MKHFTDTQILGVIEQELREKLELAEENHQHSPDGYTALYYYGEVSILRNLVHTLEFYKNYTYEE